MAIVRDPRTGQLVEVPDEPVAMTAGLGIQGRNAPRPLAPVVAPEPVRAPATTRGQGPQPPRAAPTAAVGLPTGPQGRNAPVAAVPQAVAPAAPALGAQALGAQALTAPAQPQMTNAQVLSQDRENLAALVSSQPTFVGPEQDTSLAPDVLADANRRIAQTLAESRQPQATGAVTPERGNYNVQTVDRGTLSQRAGASAGLSGLGQFGGQSATEYLATMRAQDQADVARRQQSGAEARVALERSALQAAANRGTGDDRLAARRNLTAFETRQLQQGQEAGATARTGMEVAGQQEQTRQQAAAQAEQARIQGQFGLQQANLQGQYGLDEAQLTGEYGVQSAMERAAGAVQSAQAGVDPLKAQRAELLATRLRQLNAKIQAGTATDEDFLNYTSTAAAARDNTAQNPITGAPLSAAEIELEQRRNLERLQQTR